MKKKFAMVLAVLLLCLNFTGCTIEGMRKTHLLYDEAGNISFNGATYMLLPNDRQMLNPPMDYEVAYYTTTADVPMLLQDVFGDSTFVSQDGRFLQVNFLDVYCRSDYYDEMLARVQNLEGMDCYGFYPNDGVHEFTVMSLEDSAWLRSMLEQVEPENDDDGYWNGNAESYWDYVTQIETCSQDLIMRQYSYTVYHSQGEFVFESFSDSDSKYLTWRIPEEHTERLSKILELALQSEYPPMDTEQIWN